MKVAGTRRRLVVVIGLALCTLILGSVAGALANRFGWNVSGSLAWITASDPQKSGDISREELLELEATSTPIPRPTGTFGEDSHPYKDPKRTPVPRPSSSLDFEPHEVESPAGTPGRAPAGPGPGKRQPSRSHSSVIKVASHDLMPSSGIRPEVTFRR